MKRLILTGLAGLAAVTAAMGRTDASYTITNVLICPPSIPPVVDARVFINNSALIDNQSGGTVQPYATANTVYYTNYGVLSALEGFQFNTYNTSTHLYSSAGTLLNEVGAVINGGGTNDGPYFSTNAGFFLGGVGALCNVWATNIINRGTIDMGMDGLLSLQGQNVSLTGGLLNMEGFETGGSFGQAGMFPGYWGVGQTAPFNPAGAFGTSSAQSPQHWVTNRHYSAMQTSLSGFLSLGYMNPRFVLGPSNFLFQVVYVQNSEPSFPSTNINVYFPGSSTVEWVWRSTNIITGLVSTNYLDLRDDMIGITNLGLQENGLAAPNTGYRPTFIPTNYFLSQGQGGFFGTPATPGILPGIFTPFRNITAEYTAYEAIFQPTTEIVGELTGQNYSNMLGRIEVTATKQLDLRSSRIGALNYLALTATNNFTQDANTRILTASADYNLGVTNATLVVSNLLAPTCPRLSGFVDVFSTRWTNVDNTTGYTNTYFVLLVDSHLASTSPSYMQNLTLHATNVIISDVLNVLSNITIDAYNLWITTNGPKAQAPRGELIFPPGKSPSLSTLPRLLNLTNYGLISVQNTATFGSPSQPYWNFVNHGDILTLGCSIWATNFETTGLIDAGPNAASISATSATFSNSTVNALFNDISLRVGRALITNTVLNAGHNLTIWATNSLTDGGPASSNIWASGVLGFNLPIEPPIASLLGTTITDAAPAWAQVTCQWAGKDRGPTATGYNNNAGLGKLFLNSGLGGSFLFTGPTVTNALYVDFLEFQGEMANFDDSGNLANLYFAPGMKIYYAQLMINGVSYAEKLNHKNNGGLNWVSGYAGAFSGTNVVYPDGTTNWLNQALVESCDLDSNGNGIPNCMDPAPVLVPSEVALTAAFTNVPPRSVALSWFTIPYSTNFVYFKPSVTASNWQLLTSFVFNSPVAGRTRVVDPLGLGARYYSVRVDALSP
jgi:hypothetical protein